MFISKFLLQRMFAVISEECLSLLANYIVCIMNNYEGNTKGKSPNIYIFMFIAVSCFTCLRPINLDAICIFFFLLHDHFDLDNFGKVFDGR